MPTKIEKTDEEWRAELTPEQYHVLREHGTERAFTGIYNDCKDDGVYRCAACNSQLFDAQDKFDSGTGWPSFDRPLENGTVELKKDRSMFMSRTEVLCGTCGSHLGHVFDDGPRETTGQRFCMNSAALNLDTEAKAPAEEA